MIESGTVMNGIVPKWFQFRAFKPYGNGRGTMPSRRKVSVPRLKQITSKLILVKFTSSLLAYSYQFLRVCYNLATLRAILRFERQIRRNKNPNFRLWTIGIKKYLFNLKPVPMTAISTLQSKFRSHNYA